MIKKEKIFELKIEEDDELSGVDAVSLVDEPAIEINWLAFNKTQEDFFIPDGEDMKFSSMILEKGQSEEELLNDGWDMVKEDFISSSPNSPSFEDTEERLIRYKYVINPQADGAPIKDTTRDFCRDLLQKNFVYRVEDLEGITNDLGSSAMVWRGSYNCRHLWKKIEYRKGDTIVNKASVTKGRIDGAESYDVLGLPQPDTRVPGKASFGYDNPLPPYVDEIGKKIKCKECEHEWNMEDGGEKPYMCNKCGYDNSVTSKSLVEPTTFNKSKQYFKIDNEEKRIVLGPAMIPDQKIFRKDAMGNPYYVFFTAETIRMIAEKYMKNQYTRNNDLMHDGKAVRDVYVIESWIKEDESDKSVKYGFGDVPVGTWMLSMKIAKTPMGDKVWSQVKEGKLNGFSVSGFFEEVQSFSREEMFLYKVAEILKKC